MSKEMIELLEEKENNENTSLEFEDLDSNTNSTKYC